MHDKDNQHWATKPQPDDTGKLPVLSFLIQGFKNERDGRPVELGSADDAWSHNGPAGVSESIAKVLRAHNLQPKDVISISTTTGYGKAPGRDVGSWEFWIFCRNPLYGTRMTPWGPDDLSDSLPLPKLQAG